MGPWNPAVIGPIVGAIIVTVLTAGVVSVLILRPLTTRLGELLEQMRRERQRSAGGGDRQMSELLERVLDRLERLETRQEFMERVVEDAGWRVSPGEPLTSPLSSQPSGQRE